ncbi:MAG: flagellar basal body L-ring protein FlgH [Calditrichia bacterium]
MIRKSFRTGIIFIILYACTLIAQDMGKGVSLFSDVKSLKVGQGVTVLIMEFSQANNDARTENRKDAEHGIGIKETDGLLGFLPKTSLDGSVRNDFRGYAKTTRRGELRAKVAAKIIGYTESGDFLIEGSKLIEINNEKEIFIIRGAVRPTDINSDNTVYSYNIYDAEIVYKGKGEVSRGQKAGFLTRFLQWVF